MINLSSFKTLFKSITLMAEEHTLKADILMTCGTLLRLAGLGARLGSIYVFTDLLNVFGDDTEGQEIDVNTVTINTLAYGGAWLGGQLLEHIGIQLTQMGLSTITERIAYRTMQALSVDDLKNYENEATIMKTLLPLDYVHASVKGIGLNNLSIILKVAELLSVTGIIARGNLTNDEYVWLGSVGIITIYFGLLIGAGYAEKIYENKKRIASKEMFKKVFDVVDNILTIRIYLQQDNMLERYKASQGPYEKAYDQTTAVENTFNLLRDIFIAIGLVCVTYASTVAVLDPDVPFTIDDLVLVNFYYLLYVAPLRELSEIVNRIAQAIPNFEEIVDLLERTKLAEAQAKNSKLLISADSSKKIDPSNLIQFSEISYIQGEDRTILDNCDNFYIKPGETVALIGNSGSGKSTLTKLILGQYEPSKGRIFMNGEAYSYTEEGRRKILKSIASVTQKTSMFKDTFFFNAAFSRLPIKDENKKDFKQLFETTMEQAQLTPLYNRKGGMDSQEPIGMISGGEEQRIGISRAIFKQPKLYILDEATASLDGKTEKAIVDTFNNMLIASQTDNTADTNPALLVITHRLETIKKADRIYYIDEKTHVLVEKTYEDMLKLFGHDSSFGINKDKKRENKEEIKEDLQGVQIMEVDEITDIDKRDRSFAPS